MCKYSANVVNDDNFINGTWVLAEANSLGNLIQLVGRWKLKSKSGTSCGVLDAHS